MVKNRSMFYPGGFGIGVSEKAEGKMKKQKTFLKAFILNGLFTLLIHSINR